MQNNTALGGLPSFFEPGLGASAPKISPRCIRSFSHGISDIQALYKQGIRLIMLKATEGTTYRNFQYKACAEAIAAFNQEVPAKDAIRLAAVHYLRNTSDPTTQAENFVNTVEEALVPTTFVVCVGRHYDKDTDAVQIQTVQQVQTFRGTVATRTGCRPPIVKGNCSHLDQVYLTSDNFGAQLCFDNWGSEEKPTSSLPVAWSNYAIWEYNKEGLCQHNPDITSEQFLADMDAFAYTSNQNENAPRLG